MRIFMQRSISAGCLALTFGMFADSRVMSASERGLQLAQVQMQQTVPQNPGTPPRTGPTRPPLESKSAVLTTEQENKQLKERVSKQDAEIQKLTVDLKRSTTQSNNQAQQIIQLTKQIGEFTQKGGRQVRAYCESDWVSRNTAGATNNCALSGFLCESVSGLCRARCARTAECAMGFVCDNAACIRP